MDIGFYGESDTLVIIFKSHETKAAQDVIHIMIEARESQDLDASELHKEEKHIIKEGENFNIVFTPANMWLGIHVLRAIADRSIEQGTNPFMEMDTLNKFIAERLNPITEIVVN